MFRCSLVTLFSGLALTCASGPLAAATLDGTKQIVLHTKDGAKIPIGRVTFHPQADGGATYDLDVDYARFKTFFLSMRDFKCLEGPEILCYVPYPYAHPHVVHAGDFSWLEHDLLFFFKNPNDYGAKLTNGLYYALHASPTGLTGTPQAIDLDKIAAPPDDPNKPPFAPEDRDDIPDGSRWGAALEIR